MTPYDIYRHWEDQICFVAPEQRGILLAKTRMAIKKCEDIFDQGANTEASAEAIEVLRKLRQFETRILLDKKP